ncbi:uncharacterized protein LOC142331558 [Lycorma delicatula]|uniref:uncharacterized protein LOC142331558 n=1 Tax=Lycorma delicatula TaxID=130591 RepID=UPI003F51A036
MNRFLLFVILSLFIHSTLSEKSKTSSVRTKKEGGTHHKTDLSSSGTSLDLSFSNGGGFSSEDTSSHFSNEIVTPPPENILDTPIASSYNQNPLFSSGYNSAYNQGSFGYNSKTPFLSSYKFGSANTDGAYKSNLYGGAYSTYNQAQGNYYPGYNIYQGYQNYPGFYNDGYYNAYNYSAYSSKNPSYESGYYSGIHYPYQNSYSGYGYTPLNSGYAGYSGYDSSKYYGGAYKPGFGTSSFSSTPSISSGIYSPSYSSGSSSSSGKTGSGVATSGAITSNIYGQYQSSPSYPYSYPGYTNYQTGNYGYQSYKPYSSGAYDYKYNYQALPGVTSTVSPVAPFSKSTSSSLSTGFGTSGIGSKPVSTPNVYNYPGYSNYFGGSYKPYVSGGYDYSGYNFPGYTSTVSPLSLSKSSSGIYSATGTINPGTSSTTGISGGSKTDIFGKYTPGSSIHSYNYPGYNNYQTGPYNYGAYKPYTSAYGYYDYNKQNVGYPQYQISKAAEIKYTPGYNVYGSVTTPASIPLKTPSSFKSTEIPSVIPNIIPSTPVPPLSSFDTSKSSFGTYKFNNYGTYPSSYSGYNYPGYQQSHSYYHSGAYNDGSYKPNTYPSYQSAFNQGIKYTPSFFPTVAPSVTPAISSGIAGSGLSSYSGSNLAGKTGSSSADGSIQSIYSNSYDFSSYGKNVPSFPVTTVKPIAYQSSGYNYNAGYNYPYQYGGYQDSIYKSGVNYPYFNNYGYSKYSQYPGYVGSVDSSGKYLSGYHAGQYYNTGGLHNFPESLSYVSSGQSIFPSTTTVAPIESTTIKK